MWTKALRAVLVVFLLMVSHRPVSSVESECLETHSVFYGVLIAAESVLKESRCKAELKSISESFVQNEVWALKLYDASGAPSPGVHWGNTFWLGSRTQCLAASWTRQRYAILNPKPDYRVIDPSATPPFSVDYFVAYMLHHSELQIPNNHPNETKIALGLCLPSSCQVDEIQTVLREYVSSDKFSFKDIYNTSLEAMEVKKTEDSFDTDDPLARLFMFVLLAIAALVAAGTAYDYRLTKSFTQKTDREKNNNLIEKRGEDSGEHCSQKALIADGVLLKVLLSFSFIRSYNSVFKMTDPKLEFKPICGIRACTSFVVVLCHSFLFLISFVRNRTYGHTTFDTLIAQPILNSHMTTDVFLCLSGFLLAHGVYNNSNAPKRPSLYVVVASCLKDVVKRFIRISPSYFFMMLTAIVLASWTHKFDSLWFNERDDILCRENWWINCLFINNIYKSDKICLVWSYYVSLDMQLFLVIAFCLHFSNIHRKSPVLPLSTILVASIVCIGYTTYVTNFKPFTVNFLEFVGVLYYPPWMRIGPYVVGALYGYAYHSMNKQLNIQQKWIMFIWLVNIAAMGFIIFGFKDKNLSMPWAIFHTCFSRNIWAAGMGWIILACQTNHGGFLKDILSARIWLPLSKLTYSTYLVNMTVLYTAVSFSEKSYTVEVLNMAVIFGLGLLAFTFLVSIPLTCCVELPSTAVYNVLTVWLTGSRPHVVKNPLQSMTHEKKIA